MKEEEHQSNLEFDYLFQKCLKLSKTISNNKLYIPLAIGLNGLFFVSWYKGLNFLPICAYLILVYLICSIIFSKISLYENNE
jgi:hypothetical protein